MLHLAGDQLTTILFHRFFFEGEPAERSRDRLKRQCEWLRNHFTPVSLDFATDALAEGRLPRRPLLVTIDDAKIEILRIADIFASFDLPISIFACVGWCAKDSPEDEGGLLARLVNQIEWYAGPVKTLDHQPRKNYGWRQPDRDPQGDRSNSFRSGSRRVLNLNPSWRRCRARLPGQRLSCSWAELARLEGFRRCYRRPFRKPRQSRGRKPGAHGV